MKKNGEKGNRDVMYVVADTIIRLRYVIFIAFLVAGVYCAFSISRVKVSDDLTSFLPETMETRQGLNVMEEEFTSFATANIMVSNIGYGRAEELASEIGEMDHIVMVSFDDSEAHYKASAALFTLSFDGPSGDADVIADMNRVKELLAPYDTYISSDIGVDLIKEIASEMFGIVVLAAIVIVAVLLFTSRSYFEVLILGIVFAFAALLNMGTNFWLGTISSISNSIAVIMQLALAIDYAIIFAHRYQDEIPEHESEREALTVALAKSIIEISASSLTTIAGLVALMLMQFRLGRDMGVVLAKGIVCSLITVFLLMPGLIMLFPKQIRKTRHKNLVPDIRPWGEFLMKRRLFFVIAFVVIVPLAFIGSNKLTYAFSDSSITEITYSERRAAMHKVTDSFEHSTPLVLIVPKGDYESEKMVLREVEALDEIKDGLGLAGIEIEEGTVLTDSYNPRMFADLLDIDIELATLLYQAYGAEHEEYQPIFGNSEEYSVPMIEIFRYMYEKMDQGFVNLSADQLDEIQPLRDSLEQAVEQLEGTVHNRMVFTANVPVEGEESVQLVETIRAIAEQYYPAGSVLVLGDITSARDLGNSYTGDSILIAVLSITFVLIILLFTFKTVVGSLILVLVIQGSIWINFSIPYLTGSTPTFVVDMLVSAIQMGATIDYAIVLMNRYLTFRETEDRKNAMADAVNHAFPTLITSGLIMTVAALLIAYRCSDVYVSHIGMAVGRGALISVIMVLTALPQLLVLFDGAIKKTTFSIDLKKVVKEEDE